MKNLNAIYKKYRIKDTNEIVKASVNFQNDEVRTITKKNKLKIYTIYQFFIAMNAREIESESENIVEILTDKLKDNG